MSERDYFRTDWEGGDVRRPFWATSPATKAVLIGLASIHALLVFIGVISPETRLSIYLTLSLQPEAVLQRFHVWQLVTGPLMHANVWHLAVNLIVLWFFGKMAEDRLGMRRYLVFCLSAALAASLAFLAWAVFRSDMIPMVGASGAAMGLLVLVALWYPHTTVLFMFVIPLKLWALAVILVLLDLVQAFEATGDVANMAHLGGALYGWIYFKYGGGVERIFGAIDKFAEQRRFKKERAHRRDEAEMRREVDRILDKVNKEGMGALSEEERRFLKKASSKLRK